MKNRCTILLLFATHFLHAQSLPPFPASKHAFTVIAHRGDHTEVPENTLAAFQKAIDCGADYVEMDLRTTKDSVLVLMHDATIDRTTNGKGKLSEKTFADLRKHTIKNNDITDSTVYAIPTFDEVLDLCRDRIYIYLDFKDADVQQAYKAIRMHGMEKQVIVYINLPKQYADWRAFAPAMPLMISLPHNIQSADVLDAFLSEHPVSLLDGDYSDYDAVLLQFAAGKGIVVWPDIQGSNEANNWEQALFMGFTGLQTDHPALLIKYLKEKGKR